MSKETTRYVECDICGHRERDDDEYDRDGYPPGGWGFLEVAGQNDRDICPKCLMAILERKKSK